MCLQLEGGGEEDLDALDRTHSDYLSGASDLEDTDGEALTDNEELDDAFAEDSQPRLASRASGAALARSSEPASEQRHYNSSPEPPSERELPPLMHVPEPRLSRRVSVSPPPFPSPVCATIHPTLARVRVEDLCA